MTNSHDQTTPNPGSAPTSAEHLPRRMRGYDRSATDALLRELEAKQADLERERREQVAQLEDELVQHRTQEQLIAKTLLDATNRATEIEENARREAEILLAKAHEDLRLRTERAEQLERDRAHAESQVLRIRRLAQEMQSGLAGFLTRTIDQLRPQEERTAPETHHESGNDGGVAPALDTDLEHELSERGSESNVGSLRPA
jgi:cell division septum initiation protein DivIVA